MAKMGRPRKEIDQQIFENLCAIQCTKEEIADVFECDADTVNNWCKRTYFDEKGQGMTFSAIYKIKSAKGKMSLRRWQMKAAENGNSALLIFLGKQYLGQRDQLDTTVPETAINISVSAATPDDINND